MEYYLLNYIAAILLPVVFSGLSFIFFLNLLGDRLALRLDFGVELSDGPILGKNKTVRGPIIMGLFTGIYGFLIYWFLFTPDWSEVFRVFLGYVLVGIFYSIGELPNSFLKRRLSIPPGQKAKKKFLKNILLFIDNFDSVVACLLAYYLFFDFPQKAIVASGFLGGVVHFATDLLMIKLGLKKAN